MEKTTAEKRDLHNLLSASALRARQQMDAARGDNRGVFRRRLARLEKLLQQHLPIERRRLERRFVACPGPIQRTEFDIPRRHTPLFERRKQGQAVIYGIGAPFAPAESLDLGGFVEKISPRAFDRTLRENPNIAMLHSHDAGRPLGNTRKGTLSLRVSPAGLEYEVRHVGTSLAFDAVKDVRHGHLPGASFGFNIREDDFREEGGRLVRELLDIDLIEMSLVAFPAYPTTTACVRFED